MHDTTVDRTTDGTGSAAALHDPAFRKIHLRSPGKGITDEVPLFFSNILAWSSQLPETLLMLDVKRTSPDRVMAQVRQAHMEGRVLLLTFDRPTAQAAFAADPDVLVSVLVTSAADLNYYRNLVGDRRFAAYISLAQTPSVFKQARTMQEFVITDLLDSKNALLEKYAVDLLQQHPANILVTNHPSRTAIRLFQVVQSDNPRQR